MKKVFLALMAVAAIALTGCEKSKNEPTNEALKYAELCDKVINLPINSVESELTKAGLVKVAPNVFVLSGKQAAYEQATKERTPQNLAAVGVTVTFLTNKEDKCNECHAGYYYVDQKNANSAIVAFSDYIYSNADKDSYQAKVDSEPCADHAAFVDGVKNKSWKAVSESMKKGTTDEYVVLGMKEEKEGQVSYYVDYAHGKVNQTIDVRFTLETTMIIEERYTVAIVGDFPTGWNVTQGEAYAMTRVNGNLFTVDVKGVTMGAEYKYCILNDDNSFSNEMFIEEPEDGDTCIPRAGNFKVTGADITDRIAGFRGVSIDLPFCE